MAFLRQDNDTEIFYIRFRLDGSEVNRSLKTKNSRTAEAQLYKIEETLLLLDRGIIECATNACPIDFILKYESPKPEMILETAESYVTLVSEFGSPTKLLKLNGDEPDGFDVLYKRLRPTNRFGRTGCFDFLVLLLDEELISVEPQGCYLRGSTGPRKGAKLLWGDLTPMELDSMAAQLSDQLGVSPIVVEDALCNWQK